MEKSEAKMMVLSILTSHIGRSKSIGMGELFEAVYGERWFNKINDTRPLRKVITELRREGHPICSESSQSGGGYWLASAGSETRDYCRRLEGQALRKLKQSALIKNLSLPQLLGQLQMDQDPDGELATDAHR